MSDAALILLVEDNEKNRKLAHDVLVHQGYRVTDAESAEQALRLAQQDMQRVLDDWNRANPAAAKS